MSLLDEANEIEVDERRESVERHRLNAIITSLTRENRQLRDDLGLLTTLEAQATKPPRWLRQPGGSGHRGIVTAVLSDQHYGEVVRPEQIGYVNAYNPTIAEIRTRKFFERVLVLARDYIKGVEYDGGILMLPGDGLTGTIHEELARTNAETVMESVLKAVEWIAAGIALLADDLGDLLVPCVVGNHTRLTHKPIAKNRAQDNLDWLVYKLLEREFRHDERVTMMVADGADLLVPAYDTTYLLTHGDQFRGGTGISGSMAPIALGQHRKTRRQVSAGEPYDWMVMGHWHLAAGPGRGVIQSGTLKGVDEYAWVNNYEVTPPQLAWWVTTPEHGPAFYTPIEPADREQEGW